MTVAFKCAKRGQEGLRENIFTDLNKKFVMLQ